MTAPASDGAGWGGTPPGARQRAVEAFHRAVGLTVAPEGAPPTIREADLRISLLREEAAEVVAALAGGELAALHGEEAARGGDLAEVAALGGELADLLYVTYGAGVTFGLGVADGEPRTLTGEPAIRDAAALAERVQATVGAALEAIGRRDVGATARALAALPPLVEDVAATCGLRIGPFFDAVQEANMAKVGGPVRADGKRLKPPGWRPADLVAVLDRQRQGS